MKYLEIEMGAKVENWEKYRNKTKNKSNNWFHSYFIVKTMLLMRNIH